jgi:transmembrane 9 superfamily protein 2/4
MIAANEFTYIQTYLQSKEEKHFIHNHLTFLVKYHKDDESELSRIVGFEVKPYRFSFNFAC